MSLKNWVLIEYEFNDSTFKSVIVNRSMTDKSLYYKYSSGENGYIEVIIYPGNINDKNIFANIRDVINEAYTMENKLYIIFHKLYTLDIYRIIFDITGKFLTAPLKISNPDSRSFIRNICTCSTPPLDPDVFSISMTKFGLSNLEVEYWGLKMSKITARQIMVKNPYTILPKTTVTTTNALMQYDDVGHYPVVDVTGKLVGLVSDSDILPYTVPDKYDKDLRRKKMELADNTHVENVMTPIDKIVSFIYEDETPIQFLPKFFPRNRPAFNLLMVFNNEKDKQLTGVISWINILAHWGEIIREDINQLHAIDIAIPIDAIPYVDENSMAVAGALVFKDGEIVHRHFRVIEKGVLKEVFHFHELLPYQPIEGHRELKISYFNMRIDAITARHSLGKRTIQPNTPIWSESDENSVVKIFLSSVIGEDKSWRNRLAGLVLKNENGDITHFLNPYDIIKYYLNKNDVSD